jgi:transmembrane sensor
MAKLRKPLRDDLRDVTPDDASVERMWMNVRERLAPKPGASAWGWAMTAAACGALVLLAIVSLRRTSMAGPLLLEDGTFFAALSQPAGAGIREVALNDRSRLFLEGEAELEPLDNTGSRFDVHLKKGRVRFEVQPGGPRRWIIESGPATVEVIGTGFTVDRGAHSVDIDVLHGIVLVRGENVPSHVQRLTAGGHLHVEDIAPHASEAPAPVVKAPPPAAPAPVPGPPTRVHPAKPKVIPVAPVPVPTPVSAPAPEWESLAKTNKYAEAYAALGNKGTSSVDIDHLPVDQLMTLADVARLSGHAHEAVTVLARVPERFPEDRNASLAAFTRGRIELDDLGHPANAAEAFAQALTLGLPAALQEDALARLVEARLQAQDFAGANTALRDYEARFPSGHDRARLEKLLEKR